MMRTALDLFDAGHMHTVEVWDAGDKLAGGIYGYAVGRAFLGESMFDTAADNSAIAFIVLAGHLAHWGYTVYDSKRLSDRFHALGCRYIPRRDLCVHLQEPAPKPAGRWRFDPSLDIANWKPAEGAPRLQKTASENITEIVK